MSLHSAIYEGWVRHERFEPVRHAFRYRLFMVYLDLAEMKTVFHDNPFWSADVPNLAWFRRADHLGDPRAPLDVCVRKLVAERLGVAPAGPIRLLTHLRYFGHCFNPVSFYYCFDETDRRVRTVVAEVHNIPWHEEHCYVLDLRSDATDGGPRRATLRKAFHVSPFMAMDMEYRWGLTDPGRELRVHIENRRATRRVFTADLALQRVPITPSALTRALVRYPLMTVKVVLAIHWQALRLWRQRVPFVPHPRTRRAAAPGGQDA